MCILRFQKRYCVSRVSSSVATWTRFCECKQRLSKYLIFIIKKPFCQNFLILPRRKSQLDRFRSTHWRLEALLLSPIEATFSLGKRPFLQTVQCVNFTGFSAYWRKLWKILKVWLLWKSLVEKLLQGFPAVPQNNFHWILVKNLPFSLKKVLKKVSFPQLNMKMDISPIPKMD